MTGAEFEIHRRFSRKREYDIAFSKDRLCHVVYVDDDYANLGLFLNGLLCSGSVFEVIVVVEKGKADIDSLSMTYPDFAFLEFNGKPMRADAIDAACRFMLSRFFFFIDVSMLPLNMNFNDILRIFSSYKNPLVVTPVFVMDDRSYYPNIRVPDVKYMSIICDQLHPFYRLQDTFYPLSFIGIYDRLKYDRIGGFDLKIRDDHYQLLEFAARLWLSGFSAICCKDFALHCLDPDSLTEHINLNRYKDAVNFRIQYLYKRANDKANIKILYFLFRAVDDSFKDSAFEDRYFMMNFKTLLKRWRIGEIEEVL